MQERDKHKLEGLLKARAQDLRESRRPRSRRPVADPPAAQHGVRGNGHERIETGRTCVDCGQGISARRLQAMPRATRCLDCQRVAERAASAS